MSKLADLKAAASAKLGSVDAAVMTYVQTLEGKVKMNGAWIVGGFAAGLVIGWLLHKL